LESKGKSISKSQYSSKDLSASGNDVSSSGVNIILPSTSTYVALDAAPQLLEQTFKKDLALVNRFTNNNVTEPMTSLETEEIPEDIPLPQKKTDKVVGHEFNGELSFATKSKCEEPEGMASTESLSGTADNSTAGDGKREPTPSQVFLQTRLRNRVSKAEESKKHVTFKKGEESSSFAQSIYVQSNDGQHIPNQAETKDKYDNVASPERCLLRENLSNPVLQQTPSLPSKVTNSTIVRPAATTSRDFYKPRRNPSIGGKGSEKRFRSPVTIDPFVKAKNITPQEENHQLELSSSNAFSKVQLFKPGLGTKKFSLRYQDVPAD
jgi:hypothetical protein